MTSDLAREHVYGFEAAALPDSPTAHFLAMELVPGEDLAERSKRGAIPVDERSRSRRSSRHWNRSSALRGIALSAAATWSSSAPYDVTSTADAAGDDASRRVSLPWFGGRSQPVDVLVRAENILDATNYAGYGPVLGTPTFGKPLAAMPGRSLQIGLHLGGP